MAEQKKQNRGLMEMPQKGKVFTAEEDITITKEDGRKIIVARKGSTVRQDQLERFGVTSPKVTEGEAPAEVKAEAPTENKSAAPAAKKTSSKGGAK